MSQIIKSFFKHFVNNTKADCQSRPFVHGACMVIYFMMTRLKKFKKKTTHCLLVCRLVLERVIFS